MEKKGNDKYGIIQLSQSIHEAPEDRSTVNQRYRCLSWDGSIKKESTKTDIRVLQPTDQTGTNYIKSLYLMQDPKNIRNMIELYLMRLAEWQEMPKRALHLRLLQGY